MQTFGASSTNFNILGEEGNFAKRGFEDSDTLGGDYDYDSVMHYGKYSFTKNGLQTIGAVGNLDKNIGQRDGVSASDILQLNKLYRCQGGSFVFDNTYVVLEQFIKP